MFYANNELVKGIFLNGRNYNYLSYGFGKIIPEDRSAEQLNLNLAGKYLNKYIIEWGTVKDGYENALVSPRFDKPDSNGVFHTPFTYYYNGNIISTKEVNVLINNAHWALLNASVYNDININGNITYFATNTDFQGHNVNVFPEGENEPIYKARLNQPILSNCTNFSFDIQTRFSKQDGYPSVGNCNNFSGNFRYVGNTDRKYPGFMGFLEDCKDGIFNIDCTNMHGGGSAANITNYYNFSGIQGCNNIKLNIKGSPWQAWVHPNCYSGNCNITTYYIVPGFDRINHCNLNLYIPRDANKVEKSAFYSILSNSYNCNVFFEGTNSNLSSFRNGDWNLFLFEDLNNCNLNLLLNNSTGLDYAFGNRLNNCNIQFNNMNFKQQGFGFMSNCTLTGKVTHANIWAAFVYSSRNVNLNIDASYTSDMILVWNVDSVTGNVNLSNDTNIKSCSNSILNLYYGDYILFNSVDNCKFRLDNTYNVDINGAYGSNFNLYNAVGNAVLRNLNNVDFVERDGANYTITNLDNCYNSWIYANTLSGTIENIYNTRLELKNNNAYFATWGVNNCEITGFPHSAAYTTDCTFITSIPQMAFRWNSSNGYVTWNNVWPHATPRGSDGWEAWYGTKAGLRSVDNFSGCYLNCNNGSLLAYGGSENFNNINNMQTDIKTFYNGTVTANLPIYNMEIKLNVDCNTLNLGVFQPGPPHGFVNSSISANSIYAKNTSAYYVQVSNGVRLYCENFCDVPFSVRCYGSNDPVILINNYKTSNSSCRFFDGGLTRIGRLNFQGGAPIRLNLTNDACVFINNALLNGADVDRSLLFVGSNVTWTNAPNVTNKGVIANLANWGPAAHYLLTTRSLAWNVWDSGPWGAMSLLDYCKNV